METITGSAGNDTINAVAASPTTGAAITTINSGDSIDGGAGTDTLNLTITATNNTSLSGLTVTNVEIVNVSGANNQNTAAATLSSATTSKATTAATLTAKQAEALLATQQRDAAVQIASIVDSSGGAGVINKVGEAAVISAQTVTATTASQLAAAARAVADLTTAAAVTAASTSTTALPSGTSYTLAQYNAAALAALKSADGSTLSSDANVTARADALLVAANNVWIAVEAAASASDLVEAQKAAAGQAIVDGIAGNSAAAGDALVWVNAQIAITDAAFTALNTTAYTKAQYVAAATAVKTAFDGTTAITSNAALATRAGELDTFNDAVVAVVGDYTVAQLNAAAVAALKAADGSTLVSAGDDEDAIEARADALVTLAGTVKTTADTAVSTALAADIAADNALSVATTNAASATASVSGSQFANATQVWLVGADSNKTSLTVGAGQTAGLDGVTSYAGTVSFGATGALAVKASGGTATVAGAASGLTVSGTTTAGTTGLVLTQGTVTAATGVKTLAVDMSGASIFDVSGMSQLTTVTIGNAGAVTVNPKTNTKLASVTSSGSGAATVRIATATAIDDATTTTVNETVSAVVATGAAADVVTMATSGAGTTTVTTGAGADTVYIASVGSGVSSVSTGDDNDTVHLNVVLGSNPNLTVNAGAGNDTLVMAGPVSLSAVDYARMNTALSGFEAIRFNSAVGTTAAVDVSKFAIGTLTGFTFNAGSSVVTEVGSQTLTLARAASVTATDFVPAFTGVAPTGLDAASAGYVVGTNGTSVATVYGGNLTVSTSGSSAVALTLKGSTATVGVSATGASSTTSYSPTVTFSGSDLTSLTVNLTSARGTSTNAAAEYLSTFNAGTITNTAATTYGEHLEALASLKVNGSGVFSINTGSVAKTLAKLTTVDVSGMTAFADQDVNGLVEATYLNRSATTITLNTNVSETVVLGGARDTVVTSSTYANMDTITGFQLTANATTPTTVDTARSDVLNVGGGGFAKFTTTATTLIGALTAAGDAAGARLVFTFGGDTYVYVDGGAAGLDDADQLVKLTGSYDLDLLIQAGVLI